MKRFILTDDVNTHTKLEEHGYLDAFCLVDRQAQRIFKWDSSCISEIGQDITKVVVRNKKSDDNKGIVGLQEHCTNRLFRLMTLDEEPMKTLSFNTILMTDDVNEVGNQIREWLSNIFERKAKFYAEKRNIWGVESSFFPAKY